MYRSQGSEKFTDFCSRPARRPSGGFTLWRAVFGKSGCWVRNAHHSLSVTKTKAIYSVFPGTVTRLGRGLPASGVAY